MAFVVCFCIGTFSIHESMESGEKYSSLFLNYEKDFMKLSSECQALCSQ